MTDLSDVVIVKLENFDIKFTSDMAIDIALINKELEKENRNYLLIGPGRWGSSDRCLGIPVAWQDISQAKAIVEASAGEFHPDPSQGTHFFQNLTGLGIAYFTIYSKEDKLDWDWFRKNGEVIRETPYVAHLKLSQPLHLKIDGRRNHGVIRDHYENNPPPF